MAKNSKIEWTDHTFNPWIGCAKVSAGCANCYAETQDKFRSWTPEGWGRGKPRKRTSESYWRQPLTWNRDALSLPNRPRVFCASLADWLDDEVPLEWLADLLDQIRRTPNLDWLLLTKRPENFDKRLRAVGPARRSGRSSQVRNETEIFAQAWWRGTPPANVWIGTTIEHQDSARLRLEDLIHIPARLRFLSCEPLLGPLDLYASLFFVPGEPDSDIEFGRNHHSFTLPVDWIICGGESGPGARPMHPSWASSLRDQCLHSGIPFLFKQWGEWNADLIKTGKRQAGRMLDGREWNQFPLP